MVASPELRAQPVRTVRDHEIPRRSTGAVCQKCEPRVSDAFSSKVSSESRLIESFAASDTTNPPKKIGTGHLNHIIGRSAASFGPVLALDSWTRDG